MRHIKQGPVIRQDEQLVVIVEQVMVNEAKYKGWKQPRVWKGCLEAERREFATYREIADFVLDNPDISIIKALRICLSDGSVEDITDDVVDATEFAPRRQVYNASLNHAQAGLRSAAV